MATTEIMEPPALDSTMKKILSTMQKGFDDVSAAISGKGTVYAFYIDGTEGDPAERVTYLKDAVGMTPAGLDTNGVFQYGSWEDAFFMPRPCMLKSDGTVDYYLDPEDYTKKTDGTASDVANTSYDGNAMMEWGQNGKKIWMKIVPSADNLSATVYIADYQADEDYHDWPFHNCNGVSVDHFYTAIYNGSIINGTMRSLSGQTVSKSKTAAEEIAAARANNAGTSVLWDTEHYADITLINMLLILMGKSTDTQTVFGQGASTGGSETVNDTFTTGVHNAKGLFYGTTSGAVSSNSFGNCVKVFGMENWWGFQWRRYLGHVMINGAQKVKLTYGQEDGSTADDYVVEGVPTGAGFISTGATALSGTSGDYIKYEFFTETGMVPCGALGSYSTTWYADGCWYNNGITSVPLRGGASGYGAHGGAFCAGLTYAASGATWGFGAALSCKPLA